MEASRNGVEAPEPRRHSLPLGTRSRRELELGQHSPAQLAQLDRLGAQLHLCIETAQVEEVRGQSRQPARLGAGALEQQAGVGQVGMAVAQPATVPIWTAWAA